MSELTNQEVLELVLETSKKITYERDLNRLIDLIVDFGSTIISADRCTIWILDKSSEELWTKVAHGLDTIRIPKNSGIVGSAIDTNQTIVINNPYEDSRFNKKVDLKSGYKTKSIVVIPILDMNGEVRGAFQAINKLNENSKFSEIDIERLNIIALLSSKILEVEHLAKENRYHIQEQEKAHEKQKSIIINDLKNSKNELIDIIYKASDILSGDSYSIHRTESGDILIYILDAMGHGILPSLTSFAIASTVKENIHRMKSLSELSKMLISKFKSILTDSEQLACAFFWISKDLNYIDYFASGVYPQLLKDGDTVYKLKSNNIPIMNFIVDLKIERIEVKNLKSLLLYSDGIVEESEDFLPYEDMELLLEPELFQRAKELIYLKELEDDCTIILFNSSN